MKNKKLNLVKTTVTKLNHLHHIKGDSLHPSQIEIHYTGDTDTKTKNDIVFTEEGTGTA